MLELVLLFGSWWRARPWVKSIVIQVAICGLLHDSFTGWLRPCLSLFIGSSLGGCTHTLDLVYHILYYGWLCPYHLYHVSWDISCTSPCRFSGGSASSDACSCKAFHPSLSRASCFRGHLLHSNLSPFVTVPVTLLLHLEGFIPGLVISDKTWNYLHYSPLDMSFTYPEDNSWSLPMKIALFALARVHYALLAPMGKIL